MRTSLLIPVASLLLANQLAASPAERFAPQAYYTGARRVPVSIARDVIAIRADAKRSPAELAVVVEDAARKVAPGGEVVVVEARRLRTHGLFAVELGLPVSPELLVALARELEATDEVRVHPALSRASGRVFTDEHLVITAAPGHLDRVLRETMVKTGGTLVRRSNVPNTALVRVGAPMDFDAVHASRALQGMAGLISAEPDLYRELELRATVNDPLHANQWHLARPATGDTVPGTGQIFAHEAWEISKGNPDVVVAVFDSGIDVDHEDLVENMLPGFDPSAGDENPRPECAASADGRDVAVGCTDLEPYFESHGTSVSGVVAARGDNNIGLSGVCPNCSIMPVRLLGDQVGSGLSTAESFERAVDDGAWVINNSWGPARSRYFPLSQAERDAFDHARTAGRNGLGTVIVFAAGNSTANVASDPYASHPFSIAVAASTNLDDWAIYSNYGREIDVAAPSLGGLVEEDNHGLWTTDVTGENGYSNNGYNPGFSGTSAASPVVAGLAGLILSVNPNLTAEQVRLVLTRSADKIRADKINWLQVIGQDIETLFEYDENGHSIGFGYGRVNAPEALRLAEDPGLFGAECTAPGCPACSPEGRCLVSCQTQADCVAGTICDNGACALPRVDPTTIGAPCSAECDYCTTTLDTELSPSDICTTTCAIDDDCPVGFDCRIIDEEGHGVCAVGGRHTGERDHIFNCRSDIVRGALVVINDIGDPLCTDMCFNDDPGACPYGFHCGPARCECSDPNVDACRHFTCLETTEANATWMTPLCFADEGFGVTCNHDVDCPPGDYCNAEGRCHVDDRQGCSICNDCDSDADCGLGEVCYFTRFNGPRFCSRGCARDSDCPGDSICVETERRGRVVYICASPFGNSTTLCDSDYECTVSCRDDVPCPTGEVCENATCVPAPEPTPD
ncbi:MAG: S8 family serine peptidase, partial [Myxococcota bacterium]